MRHRASPSFWQEYNALDADLRNLADKSFEILKKDPPVAAQPLTCQTCAILSSVIENQHDPLSFPHPFLPGNIIMAFRESRLREIGMVSYLKERRTFTVRAVMTDQPQPSNCSLEDVVTLHPRTNVILTDGAFPAFKYYSNGKAILFDLLCDSDNRLTYVQTYVSATKPELALGYARVAVSQFIDTLAIHAENPISIQRMELLSLEDGGVLAFQITVPSRVITKVPKFHSLRAGGPFLNTEALYREAISNSSPYYKLLLAYRGFEGVQQVRKILKHLAADLKVDERMPKAIRLDTLELAQLQFPSEVHALKDTGELVAYYRELRDGVAHFLLDRNRTATGSLQFSSTHIYNYAAVSALLLKYLRLELIQLRDYYEKFLANRVHRYPLWSTDDRGKRHLVICPDDESAAPNDEFN